MRDANTAPKFLGALFLIIGTSLGAGMLALPVSNAPAGFLTSTVSLIVIWSVMMLGALLILEVCLLFPPGTNMLSMAASTLGLPGMVFTWFVYLFLLYSLLCGYIAGGTDVFNDLLTLTALHSPLWLDSLIFVAVFGAIVHQGIRPVDYVNRALMLSKVAVFFGLIILIAPHADFHALPQQNNSLVLGSLLVLVTSFGFATIIPTLRDYCQDNTEQLRRAVIFGSLFPLACYIVWDAVIMGVIPRYSAEGLIPMLQSPHATSDLTQALNHFLQNRYITSFFRLFSSIAVLTAFLSVALSLRDALADALPLKASGKQAVALSGITFIPPLIVVLFHPGIFIFALHFAGVFCVLLLLILPALMTYSARYLQNRKSEYRVLGGKVTLAFVLLSGVLLLILGVAL